MLVSVLGKAAGSGLNNSSKVNITAVSRSGAQRIMHLLTEYLLY